MSTGAEKTKKNIKNGTCTVIVANDFFFFFLVLSDAAVCIFYL